MSLNPQSAAVVLVILLAAVTIVWLIRRYSEPVLRQILLYLSGATWARRTVEGMPLAHRVSDRFVAGEDLETAVAVTQRLNQQGLKVTLDFLGESVAEVSDAEQARDEILRLLDCISEMNLDAGVSLKLTQLGLVLDHSLARDNLLAIVKKAAEVDRFVRVDMEDSPYIDVTLDLYRELRFDNGYTNIGVVIQSYLYRSAEDVAKLVDEGTGVRLCKGAYAEPPDLAYPDKVDTDANYVALGRILLSEEARSNRVYPAFATHDDTMIQDVKSFVTANKIPTTDFEFQMLYGIRRNLQQQLAAEGYRMRVYVPYGNAWYPYFVRRLAERPANLWFFISNFIRS